MPSRNGNVIVLAGPAGPVTVLVWSPDGSRFATSSGAGNASDTTVHLWQADGVLRVWDADGVPVAILEGCGNAIAVVGWSAIAVIGWSPDGRTLAAGTHEQQVCLWPGVSSLLAQTGAELPDWSTHQEPRYTYEVAEILRHDRITMSQRRCRNE